MANYKKATVERQLQINKYPLSRKVIFERKRLDKSNGIIVKYSDAGQQVAIIRDIETLELYARSLNHLDRFNK